MMLIVKPVIFTKKNTNCSLEKGKEYKIQKMSQFNYFV